MKKSERLTKEADEAENDFQYWNKRRLAKREEQLEMFEEKFLQTIKDSPKVKSVEHRPDQSLYMIDFEDGVSIAYYPKKDRVCIKKTNHWKSYGRTWILNKTQVP